MRNHSLRLLKLFLLIAGIILLANAVLVVSGPGTLLWKEVNNVVALLIDKP